MKTLVNLRYDDDNDIIVVDDAIMTMINDNGSPNKTSLKAAEVLSLDMDPDLDVGQNWTDLPQSLLDSRWSSFEWSNVTLRGDILPHGHRRRHRERRREMRERRLMRLERRRKNFKMRHERSVRRRNSLEYESQLKEKNNFHWIKTSGPVFDDRKSKQVPTLPAQHGNLNNVISFPVQAKTDIISSHDKIRGNKVAPSDGFHIDSFNLTQIERSQSLIPSISGSSLAAAAVASLPDSSSPAAVVTPAGNMNLATGSKLNQNIHLEHDHGHILESELEKSGPIENGFRHSTNRTSSNDKVQPQGRLIRSKRWARTLQGKSSQYHRLRSSRRTPRQPIVVARRKAVTIGNLPRIEAKIGVLVVVENSIYRQYLQDNGYNKHIALARIKRYYVILFSMMDERFGTIKTPFLSITVKISGIVVAENREESRWLEEMVDWKTKATHGRATVETEKALRRFSTWVKNYSGLPKYDHAMLFTGYLLSSKHGAGLAGMANLGGICDTDSGNSVSIVKDRGDFQNVKVATHELAHSLGAIHDGYYKRRRDCAAQSNYIMSPQGSLHEAVLKNAFYFSPCSIWDMYKHLRKPSSTCVLDDPPVHYKYDQKQPPGRLYNADMQCKLVFGKDSQLCDINQKKAEVESNVMCSCRGCWACELRTDGSTRSLRVPARLAALSVGQAW
ncbi:A disintegrin and metalloproteinase with thrombospondin motifs 3-like [Plakobranchus ocellatus]|uniref:A disintegrin and metalloproteinase with thrombospondin motifs 3-like n=1 Tax=Plakobranchus ocellatus TaxID=259542 RepID=A0AAV4DWR7_9GAST|nr:A disintegrin and metalloproteinase with thrombospondin motifs 3-like [Plakobranchus ocellatus]